MKEWLKEQTKALPGWVAVLVVFLIWLPPIPVIAAALVAVWMFLGS